MPATQVRNIAPDKVGVSPGNNNRLALTTSTGTSLVIVSEYNASFALKMYLYEVSGSGKGTVTLRCTFDPPTTNADGAVTAALFPDNSVAILVKSGDRKSLRYAKIRSSDWNHQGWEEVNTHTGDRTAESMDIDVSDSGTVFVCWNQASGTAVNGRIKIRNTSGTWISARDSQILDGAQRRSCDAASIVCLGTGAAGVRNVAFAHGVGKAGVDSGVILYTCGIDETTGAVSDAVVQRSAYMAGEADAGNTGSNPQRNAKLFRGTGNEFLLAMIHRTVNKRIGILKASYNNTVWTVIRQLQQSELSYNPVGIHVALSCRHDTSAAASHTVNFYTRATLEPSKETVYNTIAKVTNTAITYSGPYKYFTPPASHFSTYSVRFLGGGGSRNLDLSKHEVMAQLEGEIPSGSGTLLTERAYLAFGLIQPTSGSSIVATVPANEAVASSSNPDISVTVDDDQKYAQARQKVRWQFASDSAFTTIVSDYTQADSKLKKVEGTDGTGVTVVFADTLPGSGLTGGEYWMRARMIDEWGNAGGWTTGRKIYVIHAPTATPISPAGGVFLNYGSGQVTFSWSMSDPSPTDYQTAYQVQAYTNAGAVIFDTGKDALDSKTHTESIDSSYKDQLLYWVVKIWDSNDTPSVFSDPAFFNLTDPPSATITSPTDNQTVATGMPDLVATMVTSGGRKIKEVTFAITQAGKPIWSTKRVGSWNNGESVTTQVPQNYLENNQSYSLQVTVLDTGGLIGASAVRNFNVAWVPPAAPGALTVSDDPYGDEIYNSEQGGYVSIQWTESTHADFYSWNLYRKDDLLDPTTLAVIEEGEYKLVYRHYEVESTSTYKDYFAPSGYKVTYVLRQQINLNGQDIESGDSPGSSAFPMSDAYWLILDSPITDDVTLFKFNVNSDDFTDEQEEAEFTVQGRGRVVNRGQDLGPKGTLVSKIRDSQDRTARQKRLLLLDAQKTQRKTWLRNPFGDVFRVSVSQMSVSRIAGVGRSEFVDVQIPYSKVGQ